MLKIGLISELLLLLTLSATAYSCSSSNTSKEECEERYDLALAEEGSISEVFEAVEAVELKLNGDYYPKYTYRLSVDSGLVFIYDNDHNLHVFDDKGNQISSSNSKIGNGPEEFSVLMGYSWNPFTHLIQILTPQKMLHYDIHFNFVKESPLPVKPSSKNKGGYFFDEIFDLSDHLHLLDPPFYAEDRNSYVVFDSDKNEILDRISFDQDVIGPTNMQNFEFFRCHNGQILCRPMRFIPYIYELDMDNRKLIPKVEITVGKGGVTAEDIARYNDDVAQLDKFLVETELMTPSRVMPTPDKILVNTRSGNNIKKWSTVSIDRQTGKMVKVNFFDGDKRAFPMIEYVDGNTAYAVLDKQTIVENPQLVLNDSQQLEAIEHFDEENWIMLKYQLK